MKSGGRVAVSVLGGYLLGRSHKTRLAVLLALLAASGRLPGGAGEVLRRTALGGSLDQIVGDLREQLSASGSAVAKKAASSPVESLSDILHERTEALHAEGWSGERAEKAAKAVRGGVSKTAERAGSLMEEPRKKTAGMPRRAFGGREEPDRGREEPEHGREEPEHGREEHEHEGRREGRPHRRHHRGRHGEPERFREGRRGPEARGERPGRDREAEYRDEEAEYWDEYVGAEGEPAEGEPGGGYEGDEEAVRAVKGRRGTRGTEGGGDE